MKLFFTVLVFVLLIPSLVFTQNQTDRDDNRLKGSIKSVIEYEAEYEYISKNWKEKKQLISRETEYDREGNYLTDIFYNGGEVFQKRFYSFLDGERVVKEETFFTKNTVSAATLTDTKEKKVEEKKYSAKYTYKFDDKGRRIEEKRFSSNGSLFSTEKTTYKENEIEQISYNSDGTFNFKAITKFDDKGNEVEYIGESAYIAGASTFRYSYESFDAKENWTKRITKILKTKNGKSSFEPYRLYNRKITYFE